jgi:hypothetical protein
VDEHNPSLKAAVLAAVDEQLASGEPPETRQTLERLRREGFSEEGARVLLGQAVAVEVYCVLKEQRPFNRERFVRNLAALPAQPRE